MHQVYRTNMDQIESQDYNPFEVDIIVCPEDIGFRKIPYMNVTTGQEQPLKPKEETVYFVLTINNQKSFCVPYIEDKANVDETREKDLPSCKQHFLGDIRHAKELKGLKQLENQLRRLYDPQYDFHYDDLYEGQSYLGKGLRDTIPFTTTIIACPKPNQTEVPFRDLNGQERLVRTTNQEKEIAHFVLTVYNKYNYCVPITINKFEGDWIRNNYSYESFISRFNYDGPSLCLYRMESLDMDWYYPTYDFVIRRSPTQKSLNKPWYKQLFSCFCI